MHLYFEVSSAGIFPTLDKNLKVLAVEVPDIFLHILVSTVFSIS